MYGKAALGMIVWLIRLDTAFQISWSNMRPRRSHPPKPRRVKVNRRSPLGRFPPITPASLLEAAQTASELVDTGVSSPVAPRSRVNLGLGHPSNSARRVNPSMLSSNSTSSLLHNTATARVVSRTRITPSIAMSRTVRSAECKLKSSVEAGITAIRQQSADRPARPVPGPRKHSYAAAATTATPTPTSSATSTANEPPSCARQTTAQRVTPTPGSPRCAQQTPGVPLLQRRPVPPSPPRHTSLGFPLAGPTQVQSPRVLVAPYRGNPLFQPLDGAAQSIMVGAQKVGKMTSVDEEAKGKAMPAEGAGEVTYVLREDAWLKL
ncbi:hypothetical protein C8R43DRAFT_964699 [Mycena crocata]|nr:hypothetical protein C8R43DRAFT_964699 [Mycena crocata]